MLRILLVEDQIEKKQAICEAIREVDEELISSIDCVTDVLAAKKALKNIKYGLLILDINIPDKMDATTRVGSGLDILRFIRDNDSSIPPLNIIGITAYKEAADIANQELPSLIWKLLMFSYEDSSWKTHLQSIVRFSLKTSHPPFPNDGHTFHMDICIVVALEEELSAILNLPGNWKEATISYDSARYWKGHFERDGRSLSIVAAAAPGMGMPAAAILATKMITTFRPRYILMAGICAGVEGKVDIGDIIVADPCFDWGSGKWRASEVPGTLKFMPAPYQWRLDAHLSAAVKTIAANDTLLKNIRTSYEGDRAAGVPKVLVGPMASGGSVLQASMLMEDVKELHKNLIGVDMETYGIHSAAEYAPEPKPKCIVIKSVCDFGSEEKKDKYHGYAAYCSAGFLYEFALSSLVNDN